MILLHHTPLISPANQPKIKTTAPIKALDSGDQGSGVERPPGQQLEPRRAIWLVTGTQQGLAAQAVHGAGVAAAVRDRILLHRPRDTKALALDLRAADEGANVGFYVMDEHTTTTYHLY